MKKSIFLLFLCILCLHNIGNAQAIGTKKNVTLKVLGYQCGDYCAIDLKDIQTGIVYNFDNVDEKTNDHGIFDKLQQIYYDNGESDKKFVGNIYKAIIEYRKTDIYRNVSTEEPPVKTGKKKLIWMINSLTK
jgi:uncharacterized protein YuzB (UPF0349 family)